LYLDENIILMKHEYRRRGPVLPEMDFSDSSEEDDDILVIGIDFGTT